MKKAWFVLVVLFAILVDVVVAGNSTLVYTAGQSTQIQTKLIPLYNKAHCLRYGKVANCTTVQLVAAPGGCVNITTKTLLIESCTIFTSDAAGELAFLQETLNNKLLDTFQQRNNSDQADFFTACQGRSAAQQDQICVDAGLSAGCNPCP